MVNGKDCHGQDENPCAMLEMLQEMIIIIIISIIISIIIIIPQSSFSLSFLQLLKATRVTDEVRLAAGCRVQRSTRDASSPGEKVLRQLPRPSLLKEVSMKSWMKYRKDPHVFKYFQIFSKIFFDISLLIVEHLLSLKVICCRTCYPPVCMSCHASTQSSPGADCIDLHLHSVTM